MKSGRIVDELADRHCVIGRPHRADEPVGGDSTVLEPRENLFASQFARPEPCIASFDRKVLFHYVGTAKPLALNDKAELLSK